MDRKPEAATLRDLLTETSAARRRRKSARTQNSWATVAQNRSAVVVHGIRLAAAARNYEIRVWISTEDHSRRVAPNRSAARATPTSLASVASAAVSVRSGARNRRAKVSD